MLNAGFEVRILYTRMYEAIETQVLGHYYLCCPVLFSL